MRLIGAGLRFIGNKIGKTNSLIFGIYILLINEINYIKNEESCLWKAVAQCAKNSCIAATLVKRFAQPSVILRSKEFKLFC
jgi:hypothetical protein